MPNKVFEAYMHICRAYQSQRDEIYLIGFSRGAHVAKCVAHFILNFGVLQGVPEDKAREYFEQWLKRLQNPGDNSTVQVRAQHEAFLFKDVRIRACALFDTVDTMFASNDALKAVDHRLSSNIDHAIQALALSEHRDLFRQVSWYQEELLRDNTSTRLQQCWFNGCHLHVGGGGGQDYISLVPLFWMASQLYELGLDFDRAKLTKNTELVKVLPNPGQRPMARRFSTLGSQKHLDGQKLGPQDTLVRHTIAALDPILKRLAQEPDKVAVLGQAVADYTQKKIRKGRSKHKEMQRRVKNKVNWQTP
ncbi:hypothetical protein LTR70_001930 [Exophiala xenobiotica]|uniref:T6SS Phospholipase effector Tle1-like catalytic domain-containing protein n=1 Tax=Lithohypha guttulata TaxID=1690604 RepID=A0ABR0KA47_9EURO|nr:hypothetical protein LTR24_005398 [Lithohypha guttulata]KAK5326915.1 hypothetical protein LTR70_001930 [Exophiala xenobiotica]